MESRFQLRRFRLERGSKSDYRSVGQHLTHWAIGAPKIAGKGSWSHNTVELEYIAEFRVHDPETAIWSERDMYEY